MSERVYNFNPGPAMLPLAVLEELQKNVMEFGGTGMSILEISHRSKDYEAVHIEAEALLKEFLGLGDNYRVLFLGGGASTQFDMVPLNLLPAGATADYIVTGSFAEKASNEAAKIGQVHVAANTKDTNHDRIPSMDQIKLSSNPAYVHITTNNTIFGTQWKSYPSFGSTPLVADMSSDILSKPIDGNQFGLIYAGAQKNLGPAGVTIVIIRDDLLARVPSTLPTMFRYDIHAKNNSLYNTPPAFAVYSVLLVLRWLKNIGGLKVIAAMNEKKAAMVYQAIDDSNGFYRGHALPEYRSLMNVTFRLPNEDLEAKFVSEAKKVGLVNLKGHRSVGGMRTSIYNAMPVEGCEKLAEFMRDFQRQNG
jgi:phosphoserine aminotransferase